MFASEITREFISVKYSVKWSTTDLLWLPPIQVKLLSYDSRLLKDKSWKPTWWSISISTSSYTVFDENCVWQRENTSLYSLPEHSFHLLAWMILRFAVSDFRPKENSLAFAKAMQNTEENVREARFISVLLCSRVFEDVDTNMWDWIQNVTEEVWGGELWPKILKFEYSRPGFAHSHLADYQDNILPT